MPSVAIARALPVEVASSTEASSTEVAPPTEAVSSLSGAESATEVSSAITSPDGIDVGATPDLRVATSAQRPSRRPIAAHMKPLVACGGDAGGCDRERVRPCVVCGAIGFALVLLLVLASVLSGRYRAPVLAEPPSPPSSPPLSVLQLDLPPESQPLTLIAHGSCAHQAKPQAFWPAVLESRPELFVFNGDIVYGDCVQPGCPELPQAWSSLFAHATFQDAAARLPMTGLLDDHDFGLNDCDSSNPHKGLAKQLFLDRFGIGHDDPRRRP